MCSCFCISKRNSIIDKQNAVDDLKHKPYRWAVINPRPSGNSVRLQQEQVHPKQVTSQEESCSFEFKSESHFALTGLEMLELTTTNCNELLTPGGSAQQEQEVMSTKSTVKSDYHCRIFHLSTLLNVERVIETSFQLMSQRPGLYRHFQITIVFYGSLIIAPRRISKDASALPKVTHRSTISEHMRIC